MVKVTSVLIKAQSALGFSFTARAQTDMKIECVKGMHLLKVVSSLGFRGLNTDLLFFSILSSVQICDPHPYPVTFSTKRALNQ